ncbi:MAG: hypothetical protein CVV23_16190 [Ignavibacteriae bacterium HGW-Ignavibacteriae-2]|jgi:N-acetylmuramoyl-L-alanine amidase|nr:MAG: hypothetical protein CVV23_16190 [Ignavibacteriae bacterium HGW-Ignavibacteriae-2]
MNRFIRLILFVLIISAGLIYPQRLLKISVSLNGKTEHLSYVTRNGISYGSSIELSKLLGGNYFYNSEAAKVEMKFDNFRLKVTGRNQFVVLTSRTGEQLNIFQLPISTLMIHEDVFIPLTYSLKFIQTASEQEIRFDERTKHLVLTGKTVQQKNVYNIPEIENKEQPVVELKKNTPTSSKYDIYQLSVEEKTNGTLIRLKAKKKINKFSSNIQDGKLRLYISGASVDPNLLRGLKSSGFIKSAALKNVSGNRQIEFLLNEGYATHESIKDFDSDDIIITIHSKIFEPVVKDPTKTKAEWNFDAVVIDAGHGGKDAGAIGVSGVREKDINLKIALELGRLIKQKLPDVKVIYTRNNDTFVELYKRGKIANENNGKLFISIHCNSIKQKNSSTRGFEVYLLRPGKTDKAIEIAEFENSVISLEDNPDRYQKLTDENFILVSMAHSAYMRYSEKFSDLLNKNWISGVKHVPSRGVKQAGFYVLVGASMPGVLVEAGFLSNKKDEAYLNSTRGQQEIAESIFKTVKEYKAHYQAQMEAES